MTPNGQARIKILEFHRENLPDDLEIESEEYWPSDGWRPACLARAKRDEPMDTPVAMMGPTTVIDATVWMKNYPDLVTLAQRTGVDLIIEFRQSKASTVTYWNVIHARIEYAQSIGIAFDTKRQTET